MINSNNINNPSSSLKFEKKGHHYNNYFAQTGYEREHV